MRRDRRLVTVVGVAMLAAFGCGKSGTSSQGKGRPFEGSWTRTKEVQGRTFLTNSVSVVSDGWTYELIETFSSTGRVERISFDGSQLTIDGKQYDTKFSGPHNTPQAFWLTKYGQPTGASETVCGRSTELYEETIDAGEEVILVQTYWVDRETGYVLYVRETKSKAGRVVGEDTISCKSIAYK